MDEVPDTFRGWPVLDSARVAGDISQVPNLAVVLVQRGETYAVLNLYAPAGRPWEADQGHYDITEKARAEEIFRARVLSRDRMTELARKRDLAWGDVAVIRWSHLPVTGREEFTEDARYVAGKARDFPEFHKRENREVQYAIEQWLIRYSAEHTHPSLRNQ